MHIIFIIICLSGKWLRKFTSVDRSNQRTSQQLKQPALKEKENVEELFEKEEGSEEHAVLQVSMEDEVWSQVVSLYPHIIFSHAINCKAFMCMYFFGHILHIFSQSHHASRYTFTQCPKACFLYVATKA